MTNEEAKKMLEAKLKCLIAETSGTNYDCNMRLCDGCSLNYEQGNMGEQKQALDMAIQALEQEDILGKVRAEIESEIISHSGTGEEVIQAYVDGLLKAVEIIDKYRKENAE